MIGVAKNKIWIAVVVIPVSIIFLVVLKNYSTQQPNVIFSRPEENKKSQDNDFKQKSQNLEIKSIKKNNGVAIGARHKLDIKLQLQQKWYFCAPTTVSMMLSARNIVADQVILAQEMGTYEPFGTHNRDAIRVLNKHMFGYELPQAGQAGYRLETVKTVDQKTIELFKQRLIKNTKDGYPMYYTINPAKVYSGANNSEHNVAGAGYIATPDGTDVALIYYIDPYPNFQDPVYGGLKVMTPEELLQATVGVSEPNYAW